MSKIETPKKTQNFDPEKCAKLHSELIQLFQKYSINVSELLIIYGNLGYSLGASIGGYKDKGPSLEELEKLYYAEPKRLDVALMLQGILITDWLTTYEDKENDIVSKE